MVTEKIFESALGISKPWFIAGLNFDPAKGKGALHVRIDFEVGARFSVPGVPGEHPVHDTVSRTYRHLNFFQHECLFEVRVPRVKLPDGSVRLVDPPWAGKLSGLTLLFEAFVLLVCRETTFSAAARITGLSFHRVKALCDRYVDEAVSLQDYSQVRDLAVDETSRAKGHDYVSIFADAEMRKVLFVAEGRDGDAVEAFAKNLGLHHGRPTQIENVSIDMSPAYIAGVKEHLPNAQITFDKFHGATRRVRITFDHGRTDPTFPQVVAYSDVHSAGGMKLRRKCTECPAPWRAVSEP